MLDLYISASTDQVYTIVKSLSVMIWKCHGTLQTLLIHEFCISPCLDSCLSVLPTIFFFFFCRLLWWMVFWGFFIIVSGWLYSVPMCRFNCRLNINTTCRSIKQPSFSTSNYMLFGDGQQGKKVEAIIQSATRIDQPFLIGSYLQFQLCLVCHLRVTIIHCSYVI